MSTIEYAFSNRVPQADDQLNSLETFLDPITTPRIAELGIAPGSTCWEIGAGAGSIARWLGELVGPDGRVIATDIEPNKLVGGGNVEVLRHDVRTPPPAGGPFDLIHARLVLCHLADRMTVLDTLVEHLRPGGWLVVEEFDSVDLPRVLTAPEPGDAELFTRVLAAFFAAVDSKGLHRDFPREVFPAMIAAGLTDVDIVEHRETWPGGGYGFTLHEAVSSQHHDFILGTGITRAELDRVRELTTMPEFRTMSYKFSSLRGRKPAA